MNLLRKNAFFIELEALILTRLLYVRVLHGFLVSRGRVEGAVNKLRLRHQTRLVVTVAPHVDGGDSGKAAKTGRSRRRGGTSGHPDHPGAGVAVDDGALVPHLPAAHGPAAERGRGDGHHGLREADQDEDGGDEHPSDRN